MRNLRETAPSRRFPKDYTRAARALGTLAPVKRLIVNADDFGLAPGVNRAVVELNRAGALSSATLMATGSAFAPAVHLAFAQTTLGVGCHIVLVDGSPALPAREASTLIDPRRPGQPFFRPALGGFLRDLLRGRISAAQIQAEAEAQIRRVQSSGLRVSHLDSHKHTHVFPGVLEPLLRAAQRCGVPGLRNPFEPAWSRLATPRAGALRRVQVRAMGTRGRAFQRLVRKYGMATTDGALGVLATGNLDGEAIRALLRAMPEGTWELVCHPGYLDPALRGAGTRLLESREQEREALLQTIPQAAAADPELRLIDFRQLAEPSR